MTETQVRHVKYAPWFLGFSRWRIVLEARLTSGVVITEVLAEGNWMWRGRRAPYVAYTFEVSSTVERYEESTP